MGSNDFEMLGETYSEDRILLQDLGLQPFEKLPLHEEHFVGQADGNDGAYAKIWVTPCPALFFRFEVFNPEIEQTVNFATGSGTLTKSWPIAEMIMNSMLVIDAVQGGLATDASEDEGAGPNP